VLRIRISENIPLISLLYIRGIFSLILNLSTDHLCGLVFRVPSYRSRGPDSISGATKFSEKYWVCNWAQSASWIQLRSYLKEKAAVPV
jgi:hypothetical protein